MSQPHKYRRSFIHSLFWILFLVIGLCFISCRTPRYGCPNVTELKKPDNKLPWLKNTKTGLVLVTDMDGKIVCSYYEKPSK